MKRICVAALSALLLFVGACTQQTVYLEKLPETGISESLEQPQDETIIPNIPPIVGEGFVTDILGVPILRPDTHYADNYLSYTSVRVYEYGDSTLMDAVCVNSFTQPLTGAAQLVYYGTDGRVYGVGEIYTAESELTLGVGETRVYATILTEIDVQMMDFVIEVTEAFLPVP